MESRLVGFGAQRAPVLGNRFVPRAPLAGDVPKLVEDVADGRRQPPGQLEFVFRRKCFVARQQNQAPDVAIFPVCRTQFDGTLDVCPRRGVFRTREKNLGQHGVCSVGMGPQQQRFLEFGCCFCQAVRLRGPPAVEEGRGKGQVVLPALVFALAQFLETLARCRGLVGSAESGQCVGKTKIGCAVLWIQLNRPPDVRRRFFKPVLSALKPAERQVARGAGDLKRHVFL